MKAKNLEICIKYPTFVNPTSSGDKWSRFVIGFLQEAKSGDLQSQSRV